MILDADIQYPTLASRCYGHDILEIGIRLLKYCRSRDRRLKIKENDQGLTLREREGCQEGEDKDKREWRQGEGRRAKPWVEEER